MMAGVTKDSRPDPARAAAAAPRRRHATAQTRVWRVAGFWMAVVTVLAAGVFIAGVFWHQRSDTVAAKPDKLPKSESALGLIQLAPDGDTCWQVQIDNKTGRVVDRGRIACKEASLLADPKEAVRQRYSSGRLETIRESFSNRPSPTSNRQSGGGVQD